ncbi:hypothetical protein PENSPDRAFT_587192 [Peniophora sp. CONT]|nr:hypothetical protein PENSPDRAFT_587192 [Peniophora sp. CONT]
MPATEPSASSSTAESYGNFDLVKRVELDFTPVTIHKWRSRESGLTVVHLDYEAPIVKGYFTVATEIFDDTGRPHTLEHLVFMGSEKYPYKGILDHLANRGFSNGTGAWTETDHTAFTVSTAGAQGFLHILPIYVDHVLYPTLTDAGFVTEVHHVDSQGEDMGVVYSEMQGRENTPGDLMALKMQRLINPVGSAYRSETGGLMDALRKLTVEQIREYHSTYYVPHNCVLIVAGKLTGGTMQLLSVVQNEIEPTIAAHGQNKGICPAGWKRPFVETSTAKRQPISKLVEEVVEFPEQDESRGELAIGFMGPPRDEWLEIQALDHLGTYLSYSATAPLNKEYIEIDSPLATYIYFNMDARAPRKDLTVYVGSVPTEHLATFDSKLQSSFERITSGGIDLERMRMVIDLDERQVRSRLESSGGDIYSQAIISDFLYGNPDGSDIGPFLNEFRLNDELRKWTSQAWAALLTKYFVTDKRVVVIGKPSAAMAERIKLEEKDRIAKQRETLGEEGIAKAVKKLEAAKAEHERPIPTEILTSFPIPDVASISWIPVQSVQAPGVGREACKFPSGSPADALIAHLSADGQELPFFVQYDHVQSDFVVVTALLSLASLPEALRPHVNVYLAAFFNLPVVRHTGERLGHEKVVDALKAETVFYEADFGVNGIVPEMLSVCIRVTKERYATAVAWLRDLIYGAEFDRERLAINVAQIQSVLPSCKRDGNAVLASVVAGLLFNSSSTNSAVSIMPQSDFIPRLAARLKEEPDTVINEFEQMRKTITEPSGVRFSVAGNILDLSCPRSVWAEHFSEALPATPLAPLPFSDQTLSEIGRKPVKRAVVVSLATIESAFVSYTGAGIRGWQHEDWPALRVAIEVLGATESFLWRYIRGSGLAYGAYAGVDLEAGHVSFSLYRASNALAAAAQGKVVVNGLADASIALKETDLDAAKSSIVFGVTNSVAGPVRAAMAAFTNMAIRGVPARHSVEMLEKYRTVTCEDVRKVIKTYFVPLFDPESSVVVSVNSSGKADEIAEGLAKEGYTVERQKLDVEPEESNHEEVSINKSKTESGTESGSGDTSGGESTGGEWMSLVAALHEQTVN